MSELLVYVKLGKSLIRIVVSLCEEWSFNSWVVFITIVFVNKVSWHCIQICHNSDNVTLPVNFCLLVSIKCMNGGYYNILESKYELFIINKSKTLDILLTTSSSPKLSIPCVMDTRHIYIL